MPIHPIRVHHPGFEADEAGSASEIFRAKASRPAKPRKKALSLSERPKVGQPSSLADHGVLGGVSSVKRSR